MSTMVGTHLVLMDIQFGIVATSYSEVPKRGYIYIYYRPHCRDQFFFVSNPNTTPSPPPTPIPQQIHLFFSPYSRRRVRGRRHRDSAVVYLDKKGISSSFKSLFLDPQVPPLRVLRRGVTPRRIADGRRAESRRARRKRDRRQRR